MSNYYEQHFQALNELIEKISSKVDVEEVNKNLEVLNNKVFELVGLYNQNFINQEQLQSLLDILQQHLVKVKEIWADEMEKATEILSNKKAEYGHKQYNNNNS